MKLGFFQYYYYYFCMLLTISNSVTCLVGASNCQQIPLSHCRMFVKDYQSIKWKIGDHISVSREHHMDYVPAFNIDFLLQILANFIGRLNLRNLN